MKILSRSLVGLVACLFMLEASATQNLKLEARLEGLRDLIEAAPLDVGAYAPRQSEMDAFLGQQYYRTLGAWSNATETFWFERKHTQLANLVHDAPADHILELSEAWSPKLNARLADLYREMYQPIQTRVVIENFALLKAGFLREVQFSVLRESEELDEAIALELWESWLKGTIPDELIARFANHQARINGYAPRDYLNLRVGVCLKDLKRVVGHRGFRVSIDQLARGIVLVRKRYPGDDQRLSTYATNVAAIFTDLLERSPPSLSGTRLAVLEGAATLTGLARPEVGLMPSKETWPSQAFARLDEIIDEHIRNLNHHDCRISLVQGQRMAQLKGVFTPVD